MYDIYNPSFWLNQLMIVHCISSIGCLMGYLPVVWYTHKGGDIFFGKHTLLQCPMWIKEILVEIYYFIMFDPRIFTLRILLFSANKNRTVLSIFPLYPYDVYFTFLGVKPPWQPCHITGKLFWIHWWCPLSHGRIDP